MKLNRYQRKRNFDRTPEPPARVASSTSGHRFVIQKHDASRLHYDFRLEHEGVLLSWAIPKGPSLVAGDKRLAVHVEDHPLDYGSFEGNIPEVQYGGGNVMLFVVGEWIPVKDPKQGLRKGRLEFSLRGHKLRGSWLLTRMGPPADNGKENWLLIKRHDKEARAPEDADILEEQPFSVTTRRSLDQIAGDAGKVWASGQPSSKGTHTRRAKRKAADSTPIDPAALAQSKASPMPKKLQPQLATLALEVPDDDAWIHEVKFDGYRILCRIEDGKVRLFTRAGNDWTRKFPTLVEAAAGLKLKHSILDGEWVAMGVKGVSDFQALQNAMKGGSADLVYYVFDLPYCEGFDLSRCPLLERKELLHGILAGASQGVIRYSEHIRGEGRLVFENACRLGMEGVVCKRLDGVYEPRRSRQWLKVKCVKRQEFIVVGYTDPGGARKGFGALLLAYHDAGSKLVYCGRVGTGFDEQALTDLHRRMAAMQVRTSPLGEVPKGRVGRGVHWIRPELVAEVEFAEWTDDGSLRHPSFHGIREDKPPAEVVREQPMQPRKPDVQTIKRATQSPAKPVRTGTTRSRSAPAAVPGDLAGVVLSNPDRILYPEQGITKQQLAAYYASVADWMLPHVAERPLALVRCPRGRQHTCFFQKHVSEGLPEGIGSLPIREGGAVQNTVMIRDLAGLIGLVQIGVLEVHTWGSRARNVELPDRLVFDLDPGPDVSWSQVIRGALRVREMLSDVDLHSYVKTSGGKGLHVVVPIRPRPSWDEVKAFCHAVADAIAKDEPAHNVTVMTKSKRQGKIFIDYLRNGRGATSIAPYSTRSREGAPVSTPMTWNELNERVGPADFTVSNLEARLRKLRRDPWAGMLEERQSLTRKAMSRFGL